MGISSEFASFRAVLAWASRDLQVGGGAESKLGLSRAKSAVLCTASDTPSVSPLVRVGRCAGLQGPIGGGCDGNEWFATAIAASGT